MARITVEDCLQNVDNLFQLVLLAAQRARRLANGAEPTLPLENDKPTVVALREIAAGNITAEMLREPEPAPEPLVRMPTTSRASAHRSSVSETDGSAHRPWTMRLRSWDCCPAEDALRG